MNEQNPNKQAPIENDDVEAHRIPTHLTDSPENLDGDDTEAHRLRPERTRSDVETDEDDVEGHRMVAQVQPPRDADNSGNQF